MITTIAFLRLFLLHCAIIPFSIDGISNNLERGGDASEFVGGIGGRVLVGCANTHKKCVNDDINETTQRSTIHEVDESERERCTEIIHTMGFLRSLPIRLLYLVIAGGALYAENLVWITIPMELIRFVKVAEGVIVVAAPRCGYSEAVENEK